MRHRRTDIVEKALVVLDSYGLADLSMRRLGAELGLQPSALYHHFANKQTMLAALADEILARGRRPRQATTWPDQVVEIARELRDAMLAWRDGADLVATVHAFGLGASQPDADLAEALAAAQLPDDVLPVAVNTVLHFVLGHTLQEQMHLQASSVGAIVDEPREGSDFELGLGLVVGGIRVHAGQTAR